MRNLMLVAALGLAVLLASSGTGPLPGQPEKKQDNAKPAENGLLGFWTRIYYETNGDNFSSLNDAQMMLEGPRWNKHLYFPWVWKIGKDTIESGPDRKDVFPLMRYGYRIDIGGKKGTMDTFAVKQNDPGMDSRCIYILKDDLLIICTSPVGPRPERFTSSKDPEVNMTILRRGKIWPNGSSKEARALRLPD